MKRFSLALILLLSFSPISAQEKTDRVYSTKIYDYQGLQKRIDELMARKDVDHYYIHKAQAWLNSSKYEIWRNDSGWWPAEAFSEASRLTIAIEQNNQSEMSKNSYLRYEQLSTSKFNDQIVELKKNKSVCVSPLLARAEVHLVHATYESKEAPWKNGDTQIQLAQSLISRALACK